MLELTTHNNSLVALIDVAGKIERGGDALAGFVLSLGHPADRVGFLSQVATRGPPCTGFPTAPRGVPPGVTRGVRSSMRMRS